MSSFMKYLKTIHVPAFCFLIMLISISASAQMPSTDIWTLDLNVNGNAATLSNPVNITGRPGYDNQPWIFESKQRIYYSSDVNGQTDIFYHDLKSGRNVQVTKTPTSEYSPSVQGKHLFVLMVEKDSSQRIWKNPGTKKARRITELKNEQIGYYVFTGKDSVAVYILGEPTVLKIIDLKKNTSAIIADSIGRGIKLIPGENTFSFTRLKNGKASLYKYSKHTSATEFLSELPSEDYEWIDGKTILSSDGVSLKIKKIGEECWKHVQITERIALNGITRIAYSPALKKIALVARE